MKCNYLELVTSLHFSSLSLCPTVEFCSFLYTGLIGMVVTLFIAALLLQLLLGQRILAN